MYIYSESFPRGKILQQQKGYFFNNFFKYILHITVICYINFFTKNSICAHITYTLYNKINRLHKNILYTLEFVLYCISKDTQTKTDDMITSWENSHIIIINTFTYEISPLYFVFALLVYTKMFHFFLFYK